MEGSIAMQEYFERELKNITREITQLKTSQQKSAGVVPTASETVHLTILLALNTYQTVAYGSVVYEVVTDVPALVMPTLDWYYEDITQALNVNIRYLSIVMGLSNSGHTMIEIAAHGNSQDIINLINGQSVSLQANLTVRSTAEFRLEAQ